jgi:predicted nucleic acid-binding protein
MTAIVIDASAVGAALLPDESDIVGALVLKLSGGCDFVEPPHWPIELMSLILRASRRGRITPGERDEARTSASEIIEFANIDSAVGAVRALELAVKHNMSIYDAAYLALAQRRRLPLLTKDTNLLRIALLEHVELVWQP